MTVDYTEAATTRPYRPTATISGSIGLHCAAGVGAVLHPELWHWSASAIAANQALLTALGMWPRSTWLGPNLTRLPPASAARHEVALTFDDGPDPHVTPQVLDILERHGARATFFCIAERALQHRDLCREMARRGHAIENHSRRHSHAFALLGLAGFRREISAAQASLREASGQEPRFFRAPAGLRNPLLDPVLHELRLRLVSWTRRGFDTRTQQPRDVVARLTRGLVAGDILLLHDGGPARTPSGTPVAIEALPRVLDAIHGAGLRAVTLQHAIGS
jgi:peptidoglycan/xylan/chitin deacetylase (PgdA/CDA1 family)